MDDFFERCQNARQIAGILAINCDLRRPLGLSSTRLQNVTENFFQFAPNIRQGGF